VRHPIAHLLASRKELSSRREAKRVRAIANAHPPIWPGEVDIRAVPDELAAPRRDGPPYRQARLLVRSGGVPQGFVTVQLDADGRIAADRVRRAVAEQLPQAARGVADTSGLADVGTPAVSVVICTRDRADSFRTALRSLLACDYPNLDVVVVDNAPQTGATQDLIGDIGDPRVRRILEPSPGLSRARNRGVAEARGEVIAFTDDDVIVDRLWIRALVRGLERDHSVGCVTGLVTAAELETPAQQYFERKVGWSTDFVPRLFDLGAHRVDVPLYPYVAGRFGAGANFAVAREALAAVGAFDEALGAGSPAKGGEDIDYFLRLVLAGFAIAYEPAAIVWHVHRRDLPELRDQIDGYGSGLSAFLFKHLLHPRTARDIVCRGLHGLKEMRRLQQRGRADGTDDLRLWRTELSGFAAGPVRYLRGRRLGRRR
jgi:GT2 family glycosyltransferase